MAQRGYSGDLSLSGDDGPSRNNNSSRSGSVSKPFPVSSRPGSSSSFSRTPTPSKQVSLQGAKRKGPDPKNGYIDDVDLHELSMTVKLESERAVLEREKSRQDLLNDDTAKGSSEQCKKSTKSDSKDLSQPKKATANSKKAPPKKAETDSSSESDDSDDEDEGIRRAPNQLKMEFLDCLMTGDFPNATKLCKMILLYEPSHEEALKFLPLLEEKSQLDAEKDSDDDDSDESDDDSDEDSDESDSDDDSDEEERSEDDQTDEERGDSGIASGHSDPNSEVE